MKKTGFTLAEVLITLAIIGFIASITLPSLNASTGERQAAVALKKSLNSLSNAAQLSQVLDGEDWGQYTTSDQFKKSLIKRMNADPQVESLSTNAPTKSTTQYLSGTNQAVFLRDGTALIFPSNANIHPVAREINNADGYPNGYGVIVDINGKKGPNKFSYCGIGASDKSISCDSKRQVYDQFPVKIRGSMVVPNSPISKWLIAQ